MAITTTNASLLKQYTPFTGLSARERSASGIARAELIYYGDTDWDAAGAGNVRLFQVPQTTLPEDFGYVLTDVFISVTTDGSADNSAGATGQVRLYPGGVLGPEISISLVSFADRQDATGNTAIGSIPADRYNGQYPSLRGEKSVIQYQLAGKYTGLIYPFGGSQYSTDPKSTFDVGLADQLAGTPYTVRSFIRFLQYDIDQSYNYVLQSPQLTR
tara:strand:+ start:955 stop:1599 length:645 start_codon:yes stop_codon:yes gene_type:complete